MRPVDKGPSPYVNITDYHEAEPFLSDTIGRYCSFCEMNISHVPEVEHKEGKNSGGALTDWNNLLYGCKYCNTRKAQKIKKGDLGKWIWPDRDNTFLAYTYEGGLPKINEEYFNTLDNEEVYKKASTLFKDIALDYKPEGSEVKGKKLKELKDKRWENRVNALGSAESAKKTWLKVQQSKWKEDELIQIEIMAKATGFFSVWMMVFKDEPEVRKRLIACFPGTAQCCFDLDGNPVIRPGGFL